MRKILTLTLAAVAMSVAFASPKAAQAKDYPWCAQYTTDIFGSMQCSFVTRAQCMQTVHGVGGFCRVNPYVLAAEEQRRNWR
jgi:hypothetical protein